MLNAERKKEKEVEKCVMTTYRRKCRGFVNLDISVLDIEGKTRK